MVSRLLGTFTLIKHYQTKVKVVLIIHMLSEKFTHQWIGNTQYVFCKGWYLSKAKIFIKTLRHLGTYECFL